MALNTRGTQLFIYDGTAVLEIGCPTSIDPIGGSRTTTETTPCLGTGKSEKFTGGIVWDDAVVAINFDPKIASHKKLWDLFVDGTENIPFFIGFSDGNTTPTWSSGDWAPMTTRSSIKWLGAISADSVSFSEAGNAVAGSVSIVVNNPELTPKA